MPGRILLLLIGLAAPLIASAADSPDRFSRQVAPILVTRCLECHSEREANGKLVMTSKASMMKGGESGPVIVPHKPDQSGLLARVTAGEMPPAKKGQSQKLSDAEIAILKDWIAAGAEWPDGRQLDLYEATTD